MRYLFSALLILTLLTVSCKKVNQTFVIPEGTYVGAFQRLTSSGGQVSNVTITFSGNNWTGESQFIKYPALCHGTYKVIGTDSITFENACFWTAEFDWTLILSQNYKIKVVGNNLEISRDYNGVFKDVYNLTKQ
ncbi:MAG: hypothetical protein KGO81_08530 [Bacteroidota bacterium]|nr:hypothetical protein [Bacteroidota bacterium]